MLRKSAHRNTTEISGHKLSYRTQKGTYGREHWLAIVPAISFLESALGS